MADAADAAPHHDTSIKTATLDELWAEWPRGSRKDMIRSLGGNVGEALEGKEDDTPVRLSAAYNAIGHPVPKSSLFTGKDVVDASGAKIMTSAEEFKRLLTERLGKPRHVADQAAALGRRGVILFERVKSLPSTPGGVLTLWNGAETAEPGQDLFKDCAEVHLWETLPEPAEGGGKRAGGGKGHHGHAHSSHGGPL